MRKLTKAVVRGSLPYEGFYGVLFFNDGHAEKVMKKELVEPYDIGEDFQWDYFAYDTQEEAKTATLRRARKYPR